MEFGSNDKPHDIQNQQVLLNLIRNAVDAMEGTQSAGKKMVIATSILNGNMAEIAVIDSGKGLATEELSEVFDAFYTTKQNGMGMGLAISRSIIEGHGGRLWAEVNSDRGVTFRFTVPIASGDDFHGSRGDSVYCR